MDIREQLRRQLGFLERTCASFDAGYRDEAIRIAVCLRILFHDTRSSTSVLKHLSAKDISILSTVRPRDDFDRLMGWDGIGGGFGPSGRVPKLGRSSYSSAIPLADWWDQIIFLPAPGVFTRRRDLVLTAANKDGGAHVDAALTPEYESVIKMWNISGPEGVPLGPAQETHFYALRQLGYEVLNSPELVRLGDVP